MMNKKTLLFSLIFTFLSSMIHAQSASVSGTIRTADGSPAEFVNILLKESGKGTVSDKSGAYKITNIAPGNYTIQASFVGLESKEKQIELKSDEMLVVDFVLSETANQLQEIVISARRNTYVESKVSGSLRMNTPVLEAPQNIQIITSEVIKDQQSFDMLEGVQRNVSGAQKVEHWDNYARINMRGSQITPFRNGMNVHLSPWSPLAEDMSMVERIEFVKGPAGFMLANGEPGGLYNVVTKKPTGTEKGEVGFSLGSFETYRSTIDLDGKLSSNGKLLYRLNIMGQLKGSHRDFEYNNRYSFAPVIKYLVDEKTSVTVEFNSQFSQMNVIGSNYAFSKRGYADLPVNFTTAEANLSPSIIRDRSVSVLLEHQLNADWKLTTQAAFLHFFQEGQSLWPWGISMYNDSMMQRGISIWDALGINKNGQIFLNGTVKTGKIRHSILGGLDMSHKDYYADWNQGAALGDSAFNIYNPVYGTVATSDIPQWDRSQDIRERAVRYNNSYAGLYVQDEMAFFENKLRLTLAGRFTANKNSNPYSGNTANEKFTPRAGISWSLSKSLSIYGLYDQIFLGNAGMNWEGKSFKPVTGENMEIGVKKDWLEGRFNSVLSAYRIVKNNMLTLDVEHPHPVSGQFVFSRETGQQTIQGLEFDFRGELVKGLELVINYAYTDGRVTKDSDPEVVGYKIAGATTHLQNTWMTYTAGKGKIKGLRFSLGYQYQAGRSSWFVFDDSENALPDYFRLDGGIGYRKNKLSVNVLINNILNEYLYSGAPSGGLYYWQTEPMRNYRISIAYRF